MRNFKKCLVAFVSLAVCFQGYSTAETWVNVLPTPSYTALANTSMGLIAGDFDTNSSHQQRYNGLSISKNLGRNWSNLGLATRGIVQIAYNGSEIYAGTYYSVNGTNGLFISNDFGTTWNHAGPNFSAAAVAVDDKAIYLGGFNQGLWVSKDNGQTFTQKIGSGGFGPRIFAVESNGNLVLAGSNGKTYKSLDNGDTWQEIAGLSGFQFNHFLSAGNRIYAGSYDNSGLYVSTDQAKTWAKLNGFGSTAVGGLTIYQDTLYAGKFDSGTNSYSIYKSTDFGQTWAKAGATLSNLNVNSTNVLWVYSDPVAILASVSGLGVLKADFPSKIAETFKFLDIPWKTDKASDLIDKITTFFDHKYPLLGYTGIAEPIALAGTTVNFLGAEAPKPELYYSSHSGIDFALPYGTNVLAPANGMASYYFCDACGYSIKVDHLNGYQTIYEHLQKDDLITTSGKVPVFTGDFLGKVGLTGNTTGPHLHFEVTKDANLDNVFTNDFPQGRVDPFGWLDLDSQDPWNGYFWTDVFGTHTGQQSKYLWKTDLPQFKSFVVPENNKIVTYENKKFDLTEVSSLEPYNFIYKAFAQPHLQDSQNNLKYLPDTSFLLEMVDTLKNKIRLLPNAIHITIDISNIDLANIAVDGLKIYFYDVTDRLWKPLATVVDTVSKTLTADTNHLTQFAVFSQGIDTIPPITIISISGNTENGWYTQSPTITLTSNTTDINKIFYSTNLGTTWNEYTAPLQLTQNGTVDFWYKSSDKSGNYETSKETLFKINTTGKWVKTLKITGASFST